MKVLSCFDGISACQQAFKKLGIEFDGVKNQYFSSEIDKYAIQITQKNFPNTIQLGDVQKIKNESIIEQSLEQTGVDMQGRAIGTPVYTLAGYELKGEKQNVYYKQDIDLLCAGFPCQSFSIAGNRKGFDDDRGNLFFELLRIINEVKPKYYLLENVYSMSKENKKIISEKLGIDFTMINSSLLTAQQRKRIYFVGKLQEDGTYKKVEIEQPQDKGILLRDVLESGMPYQEKSHSLTASYDGAVFWNSIEKKQRSMIAEPVLYNQYNQRTLKDKPGTLSTSSQSRTAISGQVVVEPVRLGHFNKGGQGDRIYSVEGKSVSLSANGGGKGAKTGIYKIDLPDGDYFIRKLTVSECCRLQGFPDDYVSSISKTQGYKALGNSFTVPVIEHILKHLFT